MLSDRSSEGMIARLSEVDPLYIIRICTRMPVVLPSRVTEDLAQSSAAGRAVDGDPRQSSARAHRGVPAERPKRLFSGRVPVLNQAVLLNGINDNAETLEELFRGLVQRGGKTILPVPGRSSPSPGTAHFRVSMARGSP